MALAVELIERLDLKHWISHQVLNEQNGIDASGIDATGNDPNGKAASRLGARMPFGATGKQTLRHL